MKPPSSTHCLPRLPAVASLGASASRRGTPPPPRAPFRSTLGARPTVRESPPAPSFPPSGARVGGPRAGPPHAGEGESARSDRRDVESTPERERPRDDPEVVADAPLWGLDPLDRALYCPGFPAPALAASPACAPRSDAAPAPAGAPALDALVDRFLKRFAMSGDRHRGTAHLGVGAGELAGGSLTVHAEGNVVTVTLDAPPGVDGASLGARLAARLRARGLDATVDVR